MNNDWQDQIRLGLENLVDKAVGNGAMQADVFDAIDAELARLRVALGRDPDPAKDDATAITEEPANDWPAADG